VEVQERHVERLAIDEPQGLAAVRRRDDLVAVLLEELAQPGPERGVIVRHEDLHPASLRRIDTILAAGIKACRGDSLDRDDGRTDASDRLEAGTAFTKVP